MAVCVWPETWLCGRTMLGAASKTAGLFISLRGCWGGCVLCWFGYVGSAGTMHGPAMLLAVCVSLGLHSVVSDVRPQHYCLCRCG